MKEASFGVGDRFPRNAWVRSAATRCLVTPVLLFACFATAASPDKPKNVLLLYSFSERSVVLSSDLFKSELRSRVPWQINFYVEYLESRRFDDKRYQQAAVESLRATYSGQSLDLVLADSYPALELAVANREQLFPGTPIVFWDLDGTRVAGHRLWPGVTGVTENVNIRGTIDLVLRLHPRTNAVAIVTNDSEFEQYWLAAVHRELLRYQVRLSEIDLVGLPPDQLLARVAALSSETVVFFQESPQDSNQPSIGPYDLLAIIGARLPTYCIFPIICLNHGGIGGADVDANKQISLAAELSKRVLSGERAEDIPIVNNDSTQVRVDWRQLQRWHIPDSALPPGTVVLYREPTLWQRDRNYIIAALVVILAQALLIAALLRQRARKQKAEAGLRESEKRFRVMAETTPSLVWMCDKEGNITYLNSRRVEFTGPVPNAGYGNTWKDYIHPEDLKNLQPIWAQALQTPAAFSNEYRLRRLDGDYRWMFDIASPRVNGDGTFAGFIGSAIDITDQKIAQEALEKVSGRLIEAQEKERTRIARDLHDDICQRLALLSMELEQANRNGAPPSTKKKLEEIRQHCSEIAVDVQSLSHQLHSSKLDYLGVAAAIRGFCKEIAKQHKLKIDFTEHNVPTHLAKEVSLCLFRVAQEVLHNAVKYSGASHCTVALTASDNEVQLVIRDGGVGFDVEEAKGKSGLGLVSIQERVHLVRGRLQIESRPGAGTRIAATVPLFPVAAEPGSPEYGPMARAEGAA